MSGSKKAELSSDEWELVRDKLLDAYELMCQQKYPSPMRWLAGRLAKAAAAMVLEAMLDESRVSYK